MDRDTTRWEFGTGAAAIAIAAAFLWDSRKLGPGIFEPIGPAPVPRAVAWTVIALAGAMALRAGWRLAHGRAAAAAPPDYAPRPWAAAILIAGLATYIGAMGLGLVSYAPATIAFLSLAIWFLADFRRRALPLAIVIAVALGFGLRYLFTKILVTDLP
jgi:hypothetical protein